MKSLIAAICFAIAIWCATQVFSAELELSPYLSTDEFKAWFEKAKVGDRFGYSEKSGCNTCSGEVTKIDDKSVRDNGFRNCTLLACNYGWEIKVKP